MSYARASLAVKLRKLTDYYQIRDYLSRVG